jgi:hypothetical protein
MRFWCTLIAYQMGEQRRQIEGVGAQTGVVVASEAPVDGVVEASTSYTEDEVLAALGNAGESFLKLRDPRQQ